MSLDTAHPRRSEAERSAAARRKRNIAIGLAIGALCILFYAVTIVKFGPTILARPL